MKGPPRNCLSPRPDLAGPRAHGVPARGKRLPSPRRTVHETGCRLFEINLTDMSHFVFCLLPSIQSRSERDLPILSHMYGFVSGKFPDREPPRLQRLDRTPNVGPRGDCRRRPGAAHPHGQDLATSEWPCPDHGANSSSQGWADDPRSCHPTLRVELIVELTS